MRSKLTILILVAAAAGVVAGHIAHETASDAATAATIAGYFGVLADIFLRLIKMIIAPLVFATVVAGIAGTGDSKTVGRIGLKALAWFVSASLVSLLLGMLLANLFQPGANLKLPLPDAGLSTNLKTGSLSFKEFIVHVFPRSFFEAMAGNEILQILVFSVFFGIALTTFRNNRAATVIAFISELAHAMLKLTEYVMLFAPIGVFGAVAAAITTQGIGVLATYGKFIGTFYVSLAALWAVLVGAGFLFLGARVFALLATVREPMLIAFTTASSEAAYPKLMEQARPVRRRRARHRADSAARLLVQPRRLDDLSGVRGAVHCAGLRDRDVVQPADHAAARDDAVLARASRVSRARRSWWSPRCSRCSGCPRLGCFSSWGSTSSWTWGARRPT